MLEYITCTKCKKQQKRENFWYCAAAHKVCKFCNKKTNIIPGDYNTSTQQVLDHLHKVVFNQENELPIPVQLELQPVIMFLKRQADREAEIHRNKCGDTLPAPTCPGTHPEVLEVSKETDGTTGDSNSKEESK